MTDRDRQPHAGEDDSADDVAAGLRGEMREYKIIAAVLTVAIVVLTVVLWDELGAIFAPVEPLTGDPISGDPGSEP